MEQQIKQRLVGAVVLVSLAVIFLPMAFDGRRVEAPGAVPAEIPPEPRPSSAAPLERLSPSLTVLPVEGAARAAVDEPPPAAAEPTATPAPRTTPEPKPTPAPIQRTVESPSGWSVQVGSFSTRATAEKLSNRLRQAGYDGYVVAPRGESRYYKVRVGPELERARAGAIMERLKGERKIDGFLVKHQ